ncbi:MAG: UDP-N-acetylmuramoyl-L-alanyl-D-glutamate--2,6-diaminopimelate ligase [Candidatus Babeliales bacterium]
MAILLPTVYRVTSHTKHVGPGTTFVAVKGMKQDGIDFIGEALNLGASSIVIQEAVQLSDATMSALERAGAQLVRVTDTRLALAQLSAQAYGNPAQQLTIIGVTGTKGKSTTCFLIEQILRTAGYATALISSVRNAIGTTYFETHLTTPQPDFIQMFLAQCVQAGVTHVVIEVAAQALTLHRVHGITFDSVLFTNFDQEHLEFYASMDDYFVAKEQLMSRVKAGGIAWVNGDDTRCAMLKNNYAHVRTYGVTAGVDVLVRMQSRDTGAQVHEGDACWQSPALLGLFNGYNMTAALCVARSLDIPDAVIHNAFHTFTGVPGRVERYSLPNGAIACIDKAHNPSSFHAILSTLRGITSHLIVIFGAGGERDKSKRPLMGAIAASFGDLVFITTDDPRSEDPATIIQEIYAGIEPALQARVVCEVDREIAIRAAYAASKPGTIIALLGKGVDEYQLIQGIKQPFSERAILASL